MKAFFLILLFTGCTWSVIVGQNIGPDLAQLYQDSAWTLLESDLYDEAEKLSEKSLDIYKQILGDSDTALVHAYVLIGEVLSIKGQFLAAEDSLKQGIKILDKLSLSQSSLASMVYNKLGINCNFWRDYNKTIVYFKKALSIHLSLENKDNITTAHYYNNIGTAYYGLGDSKKATQYLKKAIDIQVDIPNFDLNDMSASYSNIAVLYNEQGYHMKALEYYKKSSSFSSKSGKISIEDQAYHHNNIGVTYYQMSDYNKALINYNKSLNLSIKKYGDNHYELISIHNNIGLTYYNLSQYEKALMHNKKALQIALKVYDESNVMLIYMYETIGLNYISLELYDDALLNINLALDIRLKKKPSSRFHSYYYLASIYYGQKDYLNANHHCKKALDILCPNDKEIFSFSNVYEHYKLMRILRLNSKIYKKLNEVTGNEMYADSIFMAYNKLYSFHNYLQEKFPEKMTQEKYLSLTFETYEGAIDLWFNNIHKAFQIAEKSKSRQLIASFKQSEAEHFANVPDSLLDKEYELQSGISYYRKQKKGVDQYSPILRDSLIQLYDNSLFELNRKRDMLIHTFNEEYPSYYQLKHNHEVVDVASLQGQLTEDQTMIEYFMGDSTLFAFVIRKDHFEVKKTSIDTSFRSLINTMRSGIFEYWLLPDQGEKKYELDKEQYIMAAHQLYQILLAPIDSLLTEKLIIIPDGLLHYIPFDALLTEKVNTSISYTQLPYAIQKHQISYSYSATLYHYLNQLPSSEADQNVLAIAPQFTESVQDFSYVENLRKGLGNLPYNDQEAWSIAKILDGTAITGSDATSKALTEHAKKYKIIHLATHAKANDHYGEDSFLAFTSNSDSLVNSDRIYTHELYNLQLDADMVVLSACESGLGNLQRGEGIISLARAFIFASARSTIASLWSVSDLSTSQIMTLFYKNIESGMTKDEALRKAKLTYLNTASRTAPFYWASFIPTGNMDPIHIKKNNSKYIYTIGGLCLLLILGYISFGRKKSETYN